MASTRLGRLIPIPSFTFLAGPHAHNFAPAPWPCLSVTWSALRAETTDRDDRCLHLPSVGRFSAPSVPHHSKTLRFAPARSPFRYRCSTATAFCLTPSLDSLS